MGETNKRNGKVKAGVLLLAALAAIGVAGVLAAANDSPKTETAKPPTQTASQTTDIKYKGQTGQNALDLLKKHATVEVKHYSFGDQVTSINGVKGNGPKYWSFYVNGKLSDVGAGSYITKDSDNIEWKLQAL